MYYLSILLWVLLPRVLILFLRLMTNWFESVFKGWFWFVLGLIFAPCTLLWYSAVQNWFYGQWEIWQIIILVFTIIIDLFSLSRMREFEE